MRNKKKLLFVCTINKMRSRTAHEIFKDDNRFLVNSAGTDSESTQIISRDLLEWADTIIVMEKYHRNKIRKLYPDIYENKKIVCLYISDDYEYMQPELISLLKYRLNDVINKGLI